MKTQLLFILALSVVLALAGCPAGSTSLQPDTGSSGGSANAGQTGNSGTDFTPSGGNSGENSSPSQPTATAGTTFEAQLSADFPTCEEVTNANRLRTEILNLVNRARMDRGLLPVRQNTVLEEQATQYACEMIAYDFFAHDNPFTGTNLSDRARQFGYRYLVIGENLAAGQPTAARAFSDWMDSPGHRANILDERFTELGIGIRAGGSFGMYWVQEFGRPADEPFRPEAQLP